MQAEEGWSLSKVQKVEAKEMQIGPGAGKRRPLREGAPHECAAPAMRPLASPPGRSAQPLAAPTMRARLLPPPPPDTHKDIT